MYEFQVGIIIVSNIIKTVVKASRGHGKCRRLAGLTIAHTNVALCAAYIFWNQLRGGYIYDRW